MSLQEKSLSSVKWTALSSIVNALLQLLQLMILARFLSAHDFGLIAILSVVIAFSQLFVDFGLSKAIIYKRNITHEQLSTLYWLNIILAIIVYIVLFICSGYIARFYNESTLSTYILVLSAGLIIQSFGQQYRTLFQKELQFNILAKIDIFAAVVSFLFLIFFVMNNYGIYAFILPFLILVFLKTILLVLKGLKIHRPSFLLKLDDTKEFISFGLYSVGNDIVSTIGSQLDILLIGKLLGTEALGIYNIMKEFILRPAQLINPIITKVTFPLMAKLNHDISEVQKVYLKVINYTSSLNFPIYIASIVLAPEIISLFLGDKWLNGVLIFQILAVWALLRSVGNPVGSLLMALGKPNIEMYWNIGILIYTPVMLWITSKWGLIGISIGNTVSMFILFVPSWYFMIYKTCKIPLKNYIQSFLPPLLISIITGIVISYFIYILDLNGVKKVLFATIIGLILIIYFYRKFNYEFLNIIISLFQKKKVSDVS